MKKLLLLLTLTLLLFSCETDKVVGYELVPVQTRDTKPCEFEVWELYDNGDEKMLLRKDYCEYN